MVLTRVSPIKVRGFVLREKGSKTCSGWAPYLPHPLLAASPQIRPEHPFQIQHGANSLHTRKWYILMLAAGAFHTLRRVLGTYMLIRNDFWMVPVPELGAQH